MTDILEEVLSDQNDEKRLSYFKRILPIVIVCTAVIVIFMLWNNWRESKVVKNNQKTSNILIQAISLMNSDKDLLEKSLKVLIETSDNRVGDLAALEQVSTIIGRGNINEAKNLLDKIINNNDYDEITAAYARLIWVGLVIDQQNISNIDKPKLEEYLNYFDQEDKVFFGTANILKAIWYIQNNARGLAKDTLQKLIAAQNVTPLIKEQAKALLSDL